MAKYDMAIIVEVEADNYEEAQRSAKHIAQGLGDSEETTCYAPEYDHDFDGQRVVYLPSEVFPAEDF